MARTRKTRTLNLKSPLALWLLGGLSSVALAALVVLLATGTVHADARLPFPALGSTAVPTATSATPATLAKPKDADEGRGDRLQGIASWYGGRFNGRRTASGERFNMYAMTACHPTLPFGTLVRVVNRRNHRAVVVRITDRGNLIDQNRIIDLSYGAAKRLAMAKDGLAEVDLHIIRLGHFHHETP